MSVGNHVYAVILAGGSGTRFWPKSRKKSPKQLCNIGGGEISMIEKTLQRLDGFIPPERRIIVTHIDQLVATKEIVGGACQHFIAEPEARNTAAALAIAALEIEAIGSQSSHSPIMISLHADHIIEDEGLFRQDLARAAGVAEKGYLCLIGIKPRYPETGYGYIEQGPALENCDEFGGYQVASFREKPELDVAKSYVEAGSFHWNSGYFIWSISTILGEFDKYLPETVDALRKVVGSSGARISQIPIDKLAKVYGQLEKIAIDNAVLEKSEKVAVVAADFGWYDIGSWDALTQCFGGDANNNFIQGPSILIDTKNTTVESDGPMVACIGLDNMVVVHAKGAILVCPKDRAQDVKKVVEYLQSNGPEELL